MKRTVRLRPGCYVLMDSYNRPSIRSAFPFIFCLLAVIVAGITLQVIEQPLTTCTPAQRAK